MVVVDSSSISSCVWCVCFRGLLKLNLWEYLREVYQWVLVSAGVVGDFLKDKVFAKYHSFCRIHGHPYRTRWIIVWATFQNCVGGNDDVPVFIARYNTIRMVRNVCTTVYNILFHSSSRIHVQSERFLFFTREHTVRAHFRVMWCASQTNIIRSTVCMFLYGTVRTELNLHSGYLVQAGVTPSLPGARKHGSTLVLHPSQ